jgi:hypothetical protein
MVPFPMGVNDAAIVKDLADVAQQLVISSACGLRGGDDGMNVRVEFTVSWRRGDKEAPR